MNGFTEEDFKYAEAFLKERGATLMADYNILNDVGEIIGKWLGNLHKPNGDIRVHLEMKKPLKVK